MSVRLLARAVQCCQRPQRVPLPTVAARNESCAIDRADARRDHRERYDASFPNLVLVEDNGLVAVTQDAPLEVPFQGAR